MVASICLELDSFDKIGDQIFAKCVEQMKSEELFGTSVFEDCVQDVIGQLWQFKVKAQCKVVKQNCYLNYSINFCQKVEE